MVPNPQEKVVEMLLSALKREQVVSSRLQNAMVTVIIVIALLAVGSLVIPQWDYPQGINSFIACLILLLIWGLIHKLANLRDGSSAQLKSLYDTLARHGDVHAIGPLLTSEKFLSEPQTFVSIRRALIGLLPRLRSTDAETLDDQPYDALCTILKNARVDKEQGLLITSDPSLVIATLQAMKHIGEERAFHLIDRLVKMRPRTERDRIIHAAAEESYLVIRERFDLTGNILVRSAEAPDENMLLRPAGHRSENAPDQLLRPSSSDQD